MVTLQLTIVSQLSPVLRGFHEIHAMPSGCCVPRCSSRRGGHQFPNDPVLRKVWLVAVRRDQWKPTAASRVCHKHFKEEDFVATTALGKLCWKFYTFSDAHKLAHLTI